MDSVTDMKCHCCSSSDFHEIGEFSTLRRVTSDSRDWAGSGRLGICLNCHSVQKPATNRLIAEIAKIYDTYQLYHQGEGEEQKCFREGEMVPRSSMLLNTIMRRCPAVDLEKCDTWLDVGCGTGHFLKRLSKTHPHTKLYGFDLHERNKRKIESIAGVEEYFHGNLKDIDRTFDFVSISHVLEHVFSPVEFLKTINATLSPGGVVLIVVPHWPRNPFDLLIADHVTHFSKLTLANTVRLSGLDVVEIYDDAIDKELILVARSANGPPSNLVIPSYDGREELEQLKSSVYWLQELVAWADQYSKSRSIGVFGTALAATWLVHASVTSFSFFVDEDPQRACATYDSRPVYLPADVPDSEGILVPAPYEIAENIASRLCAAYGTRYIAPPRINRGDEGFDGLS